MDDVDTSLQPGRAHVCPTCGCGVRAFVVPDNGTLVILEPEACEPVALGDLVPVLLARLCNVDRGTAPELPGGSDT